MIDKCPPLSKFRRIFVSCRLPTISLRARWNSVIWSDGMSCEASTVSPQHQTVEHFVSQNILLGLRAVLPSSTQIFHHQVTDPNS